MPLVDLYKVYSAIEVINFLIYKHDSLLVADRATDTCLHHGNSYKQDCLLHSILPLSCF
jgi:hypothetical protein